MAYCSYCAAVLDPNVTICARCGHATAAAPMPAAVVPVAVVARPSAVTVASVLLLISCLISLMSLASIFVMPNMLSRMPAILLGRTIGLWILWIVLTILVWQRQAWARIAILLLLAWSLMNLMLTGLRFSTAIFALVVPLLIDALRIAAAFLLFKPESNAWFKK
jgi:hypothetical protein